MCSLENYFSLKSDPWPYLAPPFPTFVRFNPTQTSIQPWETSSQPLHAFDMPINDPSLPPADGRCLLFTLPRELRDEIYRHVLTFNGLQMIYYDRRDSSGYIMTMRFDVVQVDGNKFTNHAKVNPLKLVSKALYYEARGLEFYYNTVKFISRLCAVQEFVTVLQKYPKHWRVGSIAPWWL